MKKLRRTIGVERKLTGVCGGLGKFFGIDPTIVRVVAVLLCIFPPLGTVTVCLAYALMSFIIPEETDYIDV